MRPKPKVPRIQRGHLPIFAMVWWGMSWNGATVIHFCMPGVKMTAKIYEETVLEPVVKPLNDTLFEGQHWIFQQDPEPAHRSKQSEERLANNVPTFIRAEDRTSGSLDLNRLDYELWTF